MKETLPKNCKAKVQFSADYNVIAPYVRIIVTIDKMQNNFYTV